MPGPGVILRAEETGEKKASHIGTAVSLPFPKPSFIEIKLMLSLEGKAILDSLREICPKRPVRRAGHQHGCSSPTHYHRLDPIPLSLGGKAFASTT